MAETKGQISFTIGKSLEERMDMSLDTIIKSEKKQMKRTPVKQLPQNSSQKRRQKIQTWVRKTSRQNQVDKMRGIESTSMETPSFKPKNTDAQWKNQQRLRLQNQKKKQFKLKGGVLGTNLKTENTGVVGKKSNGPKMVWRKKNTEGGNISNGTTNNSGFQFQPPSSSVPNLTINVSNNLSQTSTSNLTGGQKNTRTTKKVNRQELRQQSYQRNQRPSSSIGQRREALSVRVTEGRQQQIRNARGVTNNNSQEYSGTTIRVVNNTTNQNNQQRGNGSVARRGRNNRPVFRRNRNPLMRY